MKITETLKPIKTRFFFFIHEVFDKDFQIVRELEMGEILSFQLRKVRHKKIG